MQTTRTLAALFLACAALTACGTPTVTDSPDKADSATSPAAKKPGAGVGDTITLRGTDDKLKMAVKLNKVIGTARGKDEFNQPQDGNRFFAVELVLKNVGEVAYDDSPFNGATIIDSTGQQHNPALTEVAGGTSITSTKIGIGDTRRGLLAFEIPKKTKIVKFQFALDSGFADQTGEWSTR